MSQPTISVEGRRVYIQTRYGDPSVPALKKLGARAEYRNGKFFAWWLDASKKAQVEAVIAKHSGPPVSAADDDFSKAVRANVSAGNTVADLVRSKACIIEFRDGRLDLGYRWTCVRVSDTCIRATHGKHGYTNWDDKSWLITVSPGKWYQPEHTDRGGYIDHEDMLSMSYSSYANARPDREGRVWVEGNGEKVVGAERRRLYIQSVKAEEV